MNNQPTDEYGQPLPAPPEEAPVAVPEEVTYAIAHLTHDLMIFDPGGVWDGEIEATCTCGKTWTGQWNPILSDIGHHVALVVRPARLKEAERARKAALQAAKENTDGV